MKQLVLKVAGVTLITILVGCTTLPSSKSASQSEQGEFITIDTPPLTLKPVKKAASESAPDVINKTAEQPALEVVAAPKKWTLTEGKTIGREIMAWGRTVGWNVVWNLGKDWSIPSNTTYTGDFKSAAGEAIKTLAANGILIRGQFYDGNKTMVVSGPGVAEQ